MSAAEHTQLVHWVLPRDDLDRLRELARREERSITAEARRAIRRHVKALEREEDDDESLRGAAA
jgi:hypothetical protein